MQRIKNQDIFGVKSRQWLHFNNDKEHKTLLGGTCSVLLYIVLLFIFLILGDPIIHKLYPTVLKHEIKYNEGETEQFYHDSFNMFFAFEDGNYYKLDRAKIDVFLIHTLQVFNNSTQRYEATKTRYEIRPCTGEDFARDEFEKEYWEFRSVKYQNYYYCINNPNKTLSLIGTHSHSFFNKTYSYIKIQVDRCYNNAECSTEEEIDKWTASKQLKIKILDYKLDTLEIDGDPLFRQEAHLQSIPLNKNLRTAGGFNFRKNTLIKQDSIWNIGFHEKEVVPFTDYEFFNQDLYRTEGYDYSDPENKQQQDNKHVIGKLYGFNGENSVKWTRKVSTIIYLIAQFAGIPNLLIIVINFIVYHYQKFNSIFEITKDFGYNLQTTKDQTCDQKIEITQQKVEQTLNTMQNLPLKPISEQEDISNEKKVKKSQEFKIFTYGK